MIQLKILLNFQLKFNEWLIKFFFKHHSEFYAWSKFLQLLDFLSERVHTKIVHQKTLLVLKEPNRKDKSVTLVSFKFWEVLLKIVYQTFLIINQITNQHNCLNIAKKYSFHCHRLNFHFGTYLNMLTKSLKSVFGLTF